MEEYYDNRNMDDIECNSTPSPKLKPKKRSLVERELETTLTSRITSPISNGEATNTSRYGRARKFKNYMSIATDNQDRSKSPIRNIEKSPNRALSAYKMYASNSPTKPQSHCFDNQIENIYNQNISLSRFCSKAKSERSKSKVYIRKDLIQTRDKEETIILIKNMFSPNKNVSNAEMILSSEKINKSHEKDVSSVVKTLDFDGKKKKIQEKRLSQSDLFEQEAQCEYQVGDLVWARMGTYPFWPSIVTREPISNLFIKTKLFGKLEKNVIHVTFFGDNGRRGWILLSMLRNYSGLQEFETTRDNFTPEAKRKDHRLYAAFFVTGKRLPLWNLAVDEAESLCKEPKRLRIDILNSMLGISQHQKDIPARSKKVTRTNSDISLSESLYDSLFSEDDCKGSDSELSKNKSTKKSLDVSDVVTACLDNMAAKSGITKIQKQSHMDIWLQKAKSKTPEDSQFKQLKSEKIFKPITKLQVPSTDTTTHKKCIRNKSQSITGNNQTHEKEHDYFTRSACPNSVEFSSFNDEIIDSESDFSNPISIKSIPSKIESNNINDQNTLFNKDILGISPEILDENCAEIEVITSDDMILESCDLNDHIFKTDQVNHKIAELNVNNLQDQANLNHEENNIDKKYDEIKHYESKFGNNSKSCGDTKCMDISNLNKKSPINNINITSIPKSNFISSKRIIKIISKRTVEADLLKYCNLNKKELQTMNTVKEKPSIIIDKSNLSTNLLESNLKSDSYNNAVENSRISQNLNTICKHNNNDTETKPLLPSLERKKIEENKIHSSKEASIKNLKSFETSLYDQGETENQDLVSKIELTRSIEEKSNEKNKGDEKKDVIVLNHVEADKVSTSQSDNMESFSDDSFDIKFNYDSNSDSDNKNSEKNVTDVKPSTVACKLISHDSDIINKIEKKLSLTESCEGNNIFQNIQKNVSFLSERDREKETVQSEINKNLNIIDENKKLSRSTNKNIHEKSCDNKLIDDCCDDIVSNSTNTSSKSELNNVTADKLIMKSLSHLVEPECNDFKIMRFDVDQSTISEINSSKILTSSSKNLVNLLKSKDIKQQVTCEENDLKNIEFLKYLQQKQDIIMDENPDLTYDELTTYLFKTWKYEQNLKLDKPKSDSTEQSITKNDVCCSPRSEKKSKLQLKKNKSNQSLVNFIVRNNSKGIIKSTQLQSKNLNNNESVHSHLAQKEEPTNDNLKTNLDNKDFEKLATDKKTCKSKKDVIEKIKIRSDVFISQDIGNNSEQNKSERQVQKPSTSASHFALNLDSASDDSSYAKSFPKNILSLDKKQINPTKKYAEKDFCTDNNTKMSSEEKSLPKHSEPTFDCIINEVEHKTAPNNKDIKNDNYLNQCSSASAISDQKIHKEQSNIGSPQNNFIQKIKIDLKNDDKNKSNETSFNNFQSSDTTELISTKVNRSIALSEPNDKQMRSNVLSKHQLVIKCKGTVLISENSDSDSSEIHISNVPDLMSLKKTRDIHSRKIKSKRKKSKKVTTDTESDSSGISSSTYAEKDFSTDNSIKLGSEEKSLPKNSEPTFDCKANKVEHKTSPNNKEFEKNNLNIYSSESAFIDLKVHQESNIGSSQNCFISKDKIDLKNDNESKSNEISFDDFQNTDTTYLISTNENSDIALSERNDKQLRSNLVSKHGLTIKCKGMVLLSNSDSDSERHIINDPELKERSNIMKHYRKIKSKRKKSINITSDSESDFSSKSSSKGFQHKKSDNILNRLSGSPAKRKMKREKQLKIEDFIKKPQDLNSSFDSGSLNDCEDTSSSKKADDNCKINDLDTGFMKSEESEKVLSKRKARKQTVSTKGMDLENQEFLEYLELRQDQLMDEHPELTQEEITIYLYNTWFFEENLKSENKKTDDLEQRSLVKGLSQDLVTVKKVRKKPEIVKEKDITNNNELSTKEKSKRRAERPFYREDFSDFDDEKELYQPYKTTPEGEIKDEPSTSKNIINIDEKILTDNIEYNYVGYDGVPLEDVTEKIDQVEEYFRRLTEPKPNLFKGLAREKVCEICEKVGNLHKCKGCHGFFHADCSRKIVEIKESSPPHRGRKKKRKNRGRKPKNLDDSFDNHSDKSQEHDVSFEHEMESHTIVNAGEFEQKLSSKLKEMIENPVSKYDTNSSEEELNWSDTDVGSCKVVEIVPKKKKQESIEFKCKDCEENDTPICFVCKRTTSLKKQITHRQKCQVAQCHIHYHIECLEHWPQTQYTTSEKKGKEVIESLQCPRHVCHTCVCDDPRGCKTRFSGDKLARCVRCPATYHAFTKCLPAGSQILSGSHIICPRHYEHRPGKVPCHVNTGWCFICALGGTLICCEYCPTSFHAECLNIQPPEGGYMCEDCETGCLPLYGEMVWVKLGHYRWWPGLILHPSEIPENILAVKHAPGEFVVRFFGQYDYYWVNRGRVFPFQEGDTGRVSSRNSKIDAAFTMAVEHAHRAYEILKNRSPSNEGDDDIASYLLPPHYVKLKVNKPYGSLVNKKIDIEESSLTQCECDPDVEDPCGLYSHCLNRMLLTECGPICRAGERCCNRAFEKRQYPRMEPYRTSARGWGLRTLEDIRAGQFVIEYVGELIDEVEFQRRMKWMHQVRDENYYFLTLDKERMIDAGPKGNLARFMNHSCDPNCETQKWTVLGDVRVGLFALYDIPAKSELTFNYNLECAGIEKKQCLCGTARCSGFMGAKPKQEEPKKKKVKRTYKKRKRIEISPTNTPPKPKRREPKNRQLTEIEKDLLIIKSATNISSDSESGINSDSTKRKRLEEPTSSAKRVKLVKNFVENEMLLENEEIVE